MPTRVERNRGAKDSSVIEVKRAPSAAESKTAAAARVRFDERTSKASRALSWIKGGLTHLGEALTLRLDRDAKELYEAVKAFDNIHLKQNSNAYKTKQERYRTAVRRIERYLEEHSMDINAFIQRVAAKATNPHFRLFTADNRYGFDIRKEYKTFGLSRSEEKEEGVTFLEFVTKIVARHEDKVRRSYEIALDKKAKDLCQVYNVNIGQAQKLAYLRNKAILELSSTPAFRNGLQKNFSAVSKDLDKAVVTNLGSVQSRIDALENKMADSLGFWNSLSAYRKELTKAFVPAYAERHDGIKALETELKKLQAKDNALKRKWANLHKIAHDDSETQEKITEARNLVVENERAIKEVKAKIAAAKAEIEQLKLDEAREDSMLGPRQAQDYNAQRRELYRLLGRKVSDLKMPQHPSAKQIWTRRATRGGIALAVIGGAALADYWYGFPASKKAAELGFQGYDRSRVAFESGKQSAIELYESGVQSSSRLYARFVQWWKPSPGLPLALIPFTTTNRTDSAPQSTTAPIASSSTRNSWNSQSTVSRTTSRTTPFNQSRTTSVSTNLTTSTNSSASTITSTNNPKTNSLDGAQQFLNSVFHEGRNLLENLFSLFS